jgi:hypothetical protein
MSRYDLAGYIGAAVMAVFAFTMLPLLAVFGLSLLTLQAINAKMYNLVVLNIVSIGGFLFNYLGNLL